MTKGSKAVGRNLLPSLPLEDTELLPKGTDDIIFKLLPAVLSIWIVTQYLKLLNVTNIWTLSREIY